MKTIFLACGHNRGFPLVFKNGKWVKSTYPDIGAIGNNSTELEVTKPIVDEIVRKGVPGCVVIKVPEGLNIQERVQWINERVANVSVYPEAFAFEFHLDSGPETAKGASVWYNDDNRYTLAEGKQFLAEYTNITGLTSRHVNSDKTNRHGDLGFVSTCKCASLLVELGFITNKNELNTIRAKGVEAIIAGFVKMNAS